MKVNLVAIIDDTQSFNVFKETEFINYNIINNLSQLSKFRKDPQAFSNDTLQYNGCAETVGTPTSNISIPSETCGC